MPTPASPSSCWTELLTLLGLALFLPVRGDAIRGRTSTIALLIGFLSIAWIAADPLLHSRELVFSWLAVPDVAIVAVAVLTLAWLLSVLSRPPPAFRRALVLTLAALPLAMAGEIASWKLVEVHLTALLVVLSVYAWVFMARGMRLLTGCRQPLALSIAALAAASFLWSFGALQADPRFWVRPDQKLDRLHVAGAEWARMARAQFEQRSRIDAAIAALAPQRPGLPDVFFVGFAGYGQERIFAREIALAADVVGRRFDAAHRSLRLVNDQRDLDRWPIATGPGLRHALLGLGQVMGDEDVLFLVFSSHGDRGRGIRISSPGMAPGVIDAASLEGMLRDARIDWPIVVVSACYSGDFVERLASDRSIVIAAAAPDRKSFGCNDSRELTYFGEAFFRDALGQGEHGLREAFTRARVALERKERASGIVSSRPQAHFGPEIEARIEARIGARMRARTASRLEDDVAMTAAARGMVSAPASTAPYAQ